MKPGPSARATSALMLAFIAVATIEAGIRLEEMSCFDRQARRDGGC